MKYATLILLALVTVGCAPKIPVESSVLVLLPDGHGSGVVVGPGLVLTAWHVAETAESIQLQDGTVLPVLAATPALDTDAALLIVDGHLPPALRMDFSTMQPGDDILSLGASYHRDMSGGVFYGKVVKIDVEVSTNGVLQPRTIVDLNVGPGISGGPVIRDGKIIGIVVGCAFSYNTVVPAAYFRELFAR